MANDGEILTEAIETAYEMVTADVIVSDAADGVTRELGVCEIG